MLAKARHLGTPLMMGTMGPSIQNCFELNSQLEVLSIDPTDSEWGVGFKYSEAELKGMGFFPLRPVVRLNR